MNTLQNTQMPPYDIYGLPNDPHLYNQRSRNFTPTYGTIYSCMNEIPEKV